MFNLKSSNNSVTESHIVKDFYNDCEFLCYRNPTKCEAANIVVGDDSTYWREFVLLNTTRNKLFVLVSNKNVKHISRSPEINYMVMIQNIVSCSASFMYPSRTCDKMIDGIFITSWIPNNANVGNWVKFTFSHRRQCCRPVVKHRATGTM
ncbi:hypothetical protein LSH36_1848g00013 [Paralvinella palmiformis]|uniref:Uncharacterized protein n=1 Tax=Paralvinella palmiformis TaxID=53620 RepID=A0AAD9MPE8_9ANNE|nr:hypothetical protein LSH36_1848g00013 [Paralvinella palmiformis]